MTFSQLAVTIFILNGDPVSALSQKCFLETHEHKVKIIKPDYFRDLSKIDIQGILLIDIGHDTPANFLVLNRLIKSLIRPRLLISANEGDIFKKDDSFIGGAARILFKPFTPSDLLNAVGDLTIMAHHTH